MTMQDVPDPDGFVITYPYTTPEHAESLAALQRFAEDFASMGERSAQRALSAVNKALAKVEVNNAAEAMSEALSFVEQGDREIRALEGDLSCSPKLQAAHRAYQGILQASVRAHNAYWTASEAYRQKFGDEARSRSRAPRVRV